MGNRFLTLNGYQSLIRAHGIIAAITFLGLIPAAILIHRFLGRHEFWARRLHIWLSILSLLLGTVAFILGFIAVGPKRSLSNPHHGIGVALFTLLWFEAINGCLWRNRKKSNLHWPLSLMLHTWLGRATALLGIAQVPLGLTLYGSPVFLFVLYALWTFGLLVTYFVLEWLAGRRIERHGGAPYGTRYGGSENSYYSEHVTKPERREGGGWGKWLAAGAGAAGLAALWRRRSNREKDHHQSVVSSESSGTSWWDSDAEKRRHEKQNTGFGTRLLQVGAVAGGVAAVRKLFGRRDRDDQSDVGPYRPPLGGNTSYTGTSDTMSRVEEGLPPVRPTTPTGNSPGRPNHPLAQPPMTPGRRPSDDSYSYYSYMSGSPSRQDRKGNTFRNALAAGGAAFAVRSLFKNRRQKKEERRAEELRKERLEQERLARANSAHKYTGDGTRPPRRHHERIGSQTASDLSSLTEQPIVPGTAGTASAAATSALADRHHIRPVGADPAIITPGPASNIPPGMPPVPPPHSSYVNSSGSDIYTTGSGHQKHRHRNEAAAGLAGVAAGALGAEAMNNRRRKDQQQQNTDSIESPPVSVSVKHSKDGRQVTLRRLTEEEQAAQRRRDRRASASNPNNRRRRNSSFSSGDDADLGTSAGDKRWRRTAALEAQQAAENAATAGAGPSSRFPPPPQQPLEMPYPTPPPPGTQGIDPRTGQSYTVPAPPPIPASASNLGLVPPGTNSITSPGTETSGATEYANNRRRRRAERAQARLAREGRAGGAGGGNTVDFT
jgi:hypothetical protein